jgi:hypothetical protein
MAPDHAPRIVAPPMFGMMRVLSSFLSGATDPIPQRNVQSPETARAHGKNQRAAATVRHRHHHERRSYAGPCLGLTQPPLQQGGILRASRVDSEGARAGERSASDRENARRMTRETLVPQHNKT